MSAFRRVDGEQAGPTAVGILVPPGRRTMIIVRPRSLSWDLLPARPLTARQPRAAFLELPREEAGVLAQKLALALEAGHSNGTDPVEAFPLPDAAGYWLQVAVGPLSLLVCLRAPGQPYRPQLFVTVEDARTAVEQLTGILFPAAGVEQELYFNTRNFAR